MCLFDLLTVCVCVCVCLCDNMLSAGVAVLPSTILPLRCVLVKGSTVTHIHRAKCVSQQAHTHTHTHKP